jgi:F-type H+-transporting ATPase subunit gamma
MKMVAAAKLHRSQREMGALVPYSEELHAMVGHLASGEGVGTIPLAQTREVQRVTVVGFASNTTFCGAYNSNVGRQIVALLEGEYGDIAPENRRVVAYGRRLSVELERHKVAHEVGDEVLAEKPNYQAYRAIVEELVEEFLEGRTDRIVVVYHKFLSPGTQRLVAETLLPIELPSGGDEAGAWASTDYILEPTREALLEEIVPREVTLRLFTAALSAVASEHAARMMAMQLATDNADELIASLSLEYNKQRQQAITTELLDMMGGQRGE